MTKSITGIAASSGIAIAKAFLLETTEIHVEKTKVSSFDSELQLLETALTKAKQELEMIREKTFIDLGEDKAEIFSAHLLVLSDPEFIGSVKEKIQTEQVNAAYALHEVSSVFIHMFETIDNEYMKERAADIRDVSNRVLSHLLGITVTDPSAISEEVIIISKDLTPSDTAQLNRQYVKGFTTDIGGRTSHSAIMARSLEIPAVVGTKEVTKEIKSGDIVIIDGIAGNVIVHPNEEEIRHYKEKMNEFANQKRQLETLIHEKTVTSDGKQVELAANIGTPDDVKAVLANGCEGVGLYRTEFLYMGRHQLPTEEEQYEAYKAVLNQMGTKPVVVRTLDIGGDKELPYLELPTEMNPFLGFRAIRLCLEMTEMFRTQLRALLRASVYGNLKIMFPMIATLAEFREAKAILLEEQVKLENDGTAVAKNIEIGIMVEIPSTAVLADVFAKEVDFFSIGTNDLIQYTFAADRMNEKVSYLYQPYSPAILRLIKLVIDAAHKEGKWVGMCGEMAGDEIAIPLLLGLGLDEFSMSATSILRARNQIRKLSQQQLVEKIDSVLEMQSGEQVKEFVTNSLLN